MINVSVNSIIAIQNSGSARRYPRAKKGIIFNSHSNDDLTKFAEFSEGIENSSFNLYTKEKQSAIKDA